MTRAVRGASAKPFVGAQFATDAAAIDAFVVAARKDDELVYCAAPDLIRGEGSARVAELVRIGVVRAHQRRRAGGGWEFFIVRTSYRLPAPRVAAPVIDTAAETILAAMKRAANLFVACPSDAELARIAGLDTRDQAKWRVRKLVAAGLIETQQVTEDGATTRVVTILGPDGPGKSSLPPPKMLAAQRALRDSAGEGAR